jgi:hypothetical protein
VEIDTVTQDLEVMANQKKARFDILDGALYAGSTMNLFSTSA